MHAAVLECTQRTQPRTQALPTRRFALWPWRGIVLFVRRARVQDGMHVGTETCLALSAVILSHGRVANPAVLGREREWGRVEGSGLGFLLQRNHSDSTCWKGCGTAVPLFACAQT